MLYSKNEIDEMQIICKFLTGIAASILPDISCDLGCATEVHIPHVIYKPIISKVPLMFFKLMFPR